MKTSEEWIQKEYPYVTDATKKVYKQIYQYAFAKGQASAMLNIQLDMVNKSNKLKEKKGKK